MKLVPLLPSSYHLLGYQAFVVLMAFAGMMMDPLQKKEEDVILMFQSHFKLEIQAMGVLLRVKFYPLISTGNYSYKFIHLTLRFGFQSGESTVSNICL